MDSRTKILGKLKSSVTGSTPPHVPLTQGDSGKLKETFKTVLSSIGGAVVEIPDADSLTLFVKENYESDTRIVSCLSWLQEFEKISAPVNSPHAFQDVHLAIVHGDFAVAENGAVWVNDDLMPQRVLPFICEHLMLIVKASAIVGTMHDAYDRIGDSSHGFGVFIAGPSKTADIEQSLVLGAHGPKSMTVVLM